MKNINEEIAFYNKYYKDSFDYELIYEEGLEQFNKL